MGFQNKTRRAILEEMFKKYDEAETGHIDKRTFQQLLKEPLMSEVLLETAHLETNELIKLFDIVERNQVIQRDEFIHRLENVDHEVHERSLLKVEKRLGLLEGQVKEITEFLRTSRDNVRWLGCQMC